MQYELASSTWDEQEIAAIHAVISSGCYTMGRHVKQFEQDFARFTASNYCVMVNSGSSANLLAVASLFYKKDAPLQRGDEVIVPAVSWSTTYFPLCQYGLKIKFVDVDRDTLNFDMEQFKNAVSEHTRLIFAVNLMGNANDFEEIENIIRGRNIYLLEDNCESLGGEYKGRPLGSIGIMGTFSTFFSHHISTMEGGCVCTSDEEQYHILLSLRSHGWTRHLPQDNKICIKSDNAFEESFRFVLPGYNVRPLEISGAIGIEQLKKLPHFIKIRRQNAAYFKERFGGDQRFNIQKEIGRSSWFGFAMLINEQSGIRRADVIAALSEAGIETRPVVAGNFAKKEAVRYCDYTLYDELKNADYIDRYGFFVGNHQYDIRDKIDYLHGVLQQF